MTWRGYVVLCLSPLLVYSCYRLYQAAKLKIRQREFERMIDIIRRHGF
jgi:hypothetical protein